MRTCFRLLARVAETKDSVNTRFSGNRIFAQHNFSSFVVREKPPVGGISVNDHFEINLVPLTIGITQIFYKKIMEFCFPNKPLDTIDEFPPEQKLGSAYLSKAAKKSNFYVASPLCQDDVEQMKERAQKNKLFVYIKIPEVPINVSFKGK